jgi:hypothetical protein
MLKNTAKSGIKSPTGCALTKPRLGKLIWADGGAACAAPRLHGTMPGKPGGWDES